MSEEIAEKQITWWAENTEIIILAFVAVWGVVSWIWARHYFLNEPLERSRKMKKVLMVLIMFCVFISSVRAEETKSVTLQIEYRKLQAKNKKLENEIGRQKTDIEELQKQIIEQSKEIERLTTLCRTNNIEPTQILGKAKSKVVIVYKGKPRVNAWFEQQYKNFKDKIAFINGRYVHIVGGHGPFALWASGKKILHPIGSSSILKNGKILRIINDNEALLTRNHVSVSASAVIHVKMSTEGLFDDYEFPRAIKLINTGKYTYISKRLGKRTVDSYIIRKTLTREEFKDALRKGFDLEKKPLKTNRRK